MRWRSMLPGRLGALAVRVRCRWRIWRHGEPLECDVCGSVAVFVHEPEGLPLCITHSVDRGADDSRGSWVREVDPEDDWGRSQ